MKLSFESAGRLGWAHLDIPAGGRKSSLMLLVCSIQFPQRWLSHVTSLFTTSDLSSIGHVVKGQVV